MPKEGKVADLLRQLIVEIVGSTSNDSMDGILSDDSIKYTSERIAKCFALGLGRLLTLVLMLSIDGIKNISEFAVSEYNMIQDAFSESKEEGEYEEDEEEDEDEDEDDEYDGDEEGNVDVSSQEEEEDDDDNSDSDYKEDSSQELHNTDNVMEHDTDDIGSGTDTDIEEKKER